MGHIVHSSVSETRNGDALFFVLGWDRYGLNKKSAEMRYTEPMFSHPVGSVGHIVHSSVSRV
jgi:hypothetical protein